MIRAAISTIVRRLTTDTDAMREAHGKDRLEMIYQLKDATDDVWRLRVQLDDAHHAADELREENTRLRALAGNANPTKSESDMLAIVRLAPGLLAKQYGAMHAAADVRSDLAKTPGDPWLLDRLETPIEPWPAERYTPHLSSLYRKGLVRREKAGPTYRYWPSNS